MKKTPMIAIVASETHLLGGFLFLHMIIYINFCKSYN